MNLYFNTYRTVRHTGTGSAHPEGSVSHGAQGQTPDLSQRLGHGH